MKTFVSLILFCALSASAAVNTFTEFYCIGGVGANTNSGTTTSATATYSSVNGNWDGTSVFTPVDGSTPASSISAGDFAAVYVDGNTNATYIARITSVAAGANGAVTLSTIAKSGTAPTSSATGRTLTVGGAWGGPTIIGDNFPFVFVTGSLTNSSGSCPRVNCKGTWFVTNTIVDANNNGPAWFWGYTNSPQDGGFANIYGSNNIAGYTLHTISGKNRSFVNFLWATNGNSGTSGSLHLVNCTGSENFFYRCAAHDSRLAGFFMGAACTFHTCEAWNCNLGNNSTTGGLMSNGAGSLIVNCFSHDNTTANGHGFETDGTQAVIHCIAANNGGNGFDGTGDVQLLLIGCEAYSNSGSGLMLQGASGPITDPQCISIINCNFVRNRGVGITNTQTDAYYNGVILNCGFGTGTMTNSGGDIEGRMQGVQVINKILYAADTHPYTATNNYLISLSAAKAAGYATWLNVSGKNYTDTIGFPDIGAAQHVDSGGTTPGTVIFAQ